MNAIFDLGGSHGSLTETADNPPAGPDNNFWPGDVFGNIVMMRTGAKVAATRTGIAIASLMLSCIFTRHGFETNSHTSYPVHHF